MFNIGFSEMLIIAVIALIFIGPKELPEIARTIARFLNDLKRSTESLKDEFKTQHFDPHIHDIKKQVAEARNLTKLEPEKNSVEKSAEVSAVGPEVLPPMSGQDGPTYASEADRPIIPGSDSLVLSDDNSTLAVGSPSSEIKDSKKVKSDGHG